MSPTGIRRDYVNLASGRQVHYRRAGTGQAVLLLHPSPLSSEFMQPLMDFLSERFDVIAMDTPGYGHSDALPEPAENLAPYVQVIGEFVAALQLPQVVLYGNATGAQLAIEAAKALPQQVHALVLENAAAFSDAERAAFYGRYFPDLSPREDGSHLTLAWQMARQTYLYFPWFDTREEARVAQAEPPTELVQATALACLRAGPDYARAYRAAFENERPEQLAAVAQPVRVLLWQGSILLDYSRRLRVAGLPGNIAFMEVPAGIEARYGAIAGALQQSWEKV